MRVGVGIVLVVLVGLLVWCRVTGKSTAPGAAIELQLPALAKSLQDEEGRLASSLLWTFREYRGNAKTWSLGYHGFIILSAVLSSLAGVLIKLETWRASVELRKDVVAGMATGAALLITITSTIGFERKWQANRVAAAEVEALALEYLSLNAEARRAKHTDISDKLANVALRRHRQIAGE